MTPTPVGMRCPECSRQRTPVRTIANVSRGGDPIATYVLIAINVLMFLGTSSSGSSLTSGGGGEVYQDLALIGAGQYFNGEIVGVADGEYWRLVTGGFLHGGLLHLFFNMYILYFLGSMLEPELGRVRFLALYFASLLAGSFGAILLSPDKFTVGASGAVFGLMGAAFVLQRLRGMNPMQSGIGPLILLNLAIGFIPGLNISIGGHLGGLIGGAAAAWAIEQLSRGRRSDLLPVLACVAVGAISVVGAIVAANAEKSDLGLALLRGLV